MLVLAREYEADVEERERVGSHRSQVKGVLSLSKFFTMVLNWNQRNECYGKR